MLPSENEHESNAFGDLNELDDVFEKKDEIAMAVKEELSQVMDDFG